ncbi:MAG: family 20 glycosylhydrolase [Promethearchaeota archaeon]
MQKDFIRNKQIVTIDRSAGFSILTITFNNLKWNKISISTHGSTLDEYFVRKLNPLPSQITFDGSHAYFDDTINISISGTSEDPSTFPSLLEGKSVEYLLEPHWDIAQFGEKLIFWINMRLEELKYSKLLKSHQISVESISSKITDAQNKFLETTEIPPESRRQAYTITSNEDTICISAWTYRGAYYGIQTLSQLLTREPDSEGDKVILPKISIIDYPVYNIRGLVDDISRGQRPTLDNFKKFIRFLSRTKQNYLVLYIEDIFKWEKYPQIGRNRGVLTKEDLIEIQAYAKEWFVTIIPGVELLGHMDNMLTEPDLIEYAEFPGAQCLNISNPRTKEFVRDLIQEIAPVFEISMFAPICDESHDFGLRRSKEYVKKKGWGPALAEWYLFLIEEIRKTGKQVVLFAHDILYKSKTVMQAIQKENAVVYFWDYSDKKKYPVISKLRRQGLTVVGGPAVFDWSRHFPHFDFAEQNMINMAQDGLKRGLVGLITTKWGDFFNENFRNNIFYGLSVNAQAAWTPMKCSVPQIRHSFVWNFYTTEDSNIMKCINLLSKQNISLPRWPNGMFNRFWLDPFVRNIRKEEYSMAARFIKQSLWVMQKIKDLRVSEVIRSNLDNLDYIYFSARMALHYGVKILVSESAFHEDKNILSPAAHLFNFPSNSLILNGFRWLENDVEEMKVEYRGLWLRLAVPEGLEFPSRHFDVLKWHYEQAITDILQNQKPHAHQLKSEWIWRPGFRFHSDWGNGQIYYFTKCIHIKKKVKQALLQGIASNHMEIFVDKKHVGTVLSRFSLSQFPMAKAVQIFDVTNHLSLGKNYINVEGANWPKGIGGINVLLHLTYEDGTVEDISTDRTWKVALKKPSSWPICKEEEFAQVNFKNVRSYGKPPGAWNGPITSPIWEKGWKSSISFTFGDRNFLDTSLSSFVGFTVYRLFFWLLPIVGRFLSEDMYMNRKQG